MLQSQPLSPRVTSGLLLLRLLALLLAAGMAWLVRCPQQFPWPLLVLGGWLLSVGGGQAISAARPLQLALWQRRLTMLDLFWATLLNVVAMWQHGVPLYFPLYVLGMVAGACCWGRVGALATGGSGAIAVGLLSRLSLNPAGQLSWLAVAVLLLAWTLLIALVAGAWQRRPQPTGPVAHPLTSPRPSESLR